MKAFIYVYSIDGGLFAFTPDRVFMPGPNISGISFNKAGLLKVTPSYQPFSEVDSPAIVEFFQMFQNIEFKTITELLKKTARIAEGMFHVQIDPTGQLLILRDRIHGHLREFLFLGAVVPYVTFTLSRKYTLEVRIKEKVDSAALRNYTKLFYQQDSKIAYVLRDAAFGFIGNKLCATTGHGLIPVEVPGVFKTDEATYIIEGDELGLSIKRVSKIFV